jgi:hypothetical protein
MQVAEAYEDCGLDRRQACDMMGIGARWSAAGLWPYCLGWGVFVSMSCILHPLVWQGRYSYLRESCLKSSPPCSIPCMIDRIVIKSTSFLQDLKTVTDMILSVVPAKRYTYQIMPRSEPQCGWWMGGSSSPTADPKCSGR